MTINKINNVTDREELFRSVVDYLLKELAKSQKRLRELEDDVKILIKIINKLTLLLQNNNAEIEKDFFNKIDDIITKMYSV